MNEALIINISSFVTQILIELVIFYFAWKGFKIGRKLLKNTKLLQFTLGLLLSICCFIGLLSSLGSILIRVPNDFISILRSQVSEDLKNPEFICSIGMDALAGRDYTKALSKFKIASDLGNIPAAFFLGFMYQAGLGVDVDMEKALVYYKLAADKNYLDACTALATFYLEGEFVKRDIAKAINYLEFAANKNNAKAAHLLAKMYCGEGDYVGVNIETAKKYFKIAIKGGEDDAMVDLGAIYLNKKKNEAFGFLGMIYFDGLGIEHDDQLAFKYFQEGASAGDSFASYYLAYQYLSGRAVEQDLEKAKHYLTISAPFIPKARELLESLNKINTLNEGEVFRVMSNLHDAFSYKSMANS